MITRHAGFPMLLSRIAIANTVTKHVTPLMVISSKMWFSKLATSATAEKIDRPRPIFSGSSNPGLDLVARMVLLMAGLLAWPVPVWPVEA